MPEGSRLQICIHSQIGAMTVMTISYEPHISALEIGDMENTRDGNQIHSTSQHPGSSLYFCVPPCSPFAPFSNPTTIFVQIFEQFLLLDYWFLLLFIVCSNSNIHY